MTIEGGCLCGAIRYEAEGPPLFSVYCHCRDCQRISGAAHVPVLGVPKSAFSFTGETRTYAAMSALGQLAPRHFCPVCGSLLFGMPASDPDLVTIYVGSLDDLSSFSPEAAVFTRDRPAWDVLPDHIHQFEAGPPDEPK